MATKEDLEALKLANENLVRRKAIAALAYDPISGYNAPLKRVRVDIPDFHLPTMFLPEKMAKTALIKKIVKAGTIRKYLEGLLEEDESYEEAEKSLKKAIFNLRIKEDFTYWAYTLGKIKNKEGGGNIRFKLRSAQVKLLTVLEGMRLKNLPIRIILLKARQWGGSTLVQCYMAWIQLVHIQGFYSCVVAQDKSTSRRIRAMFSRLLKEYPPELLGLDAGYPLKLTPYEGSQSDVQLTQNGAQVRDLVINIASASNPDTVRSSDIALAHYSEVGLWRDTDNTPPQDVIRAVSSSISEKPLTMIVMESTADGVGTFFHKECIAAKTGESEYKFVFVSWFEIDMYEKPIASQLEFARKLYKNRHNEITSTRKVSGAYLWSLWMMGASFEAINWYVSKRRGYDSQSSMASEYPSTAEEAFTNSGQPVFSKDGIERLRKLCTDPLYKGEIEGFDDSGVNSLSDLKFTQSEEGHLKVWNLPNYDIKVRNRYLVVVDIGGTSKRSDPSDILVLDRLDLVNGGKIRVIAEWHGHIAHDRLAWKSAQIAKYYCNALLVIESNTLETKDKNRDTDGGDYSGYILDLISEAYPNLYAREATGEKMVGEIPKIWGFHTNTSTKPALIATFKAAINDQLYTEREQEACNEMLMYEKDKKGALNAKIGYHDDRVMTRGIGLYVSIKMEIPVIVIKKAVREIRHKRLTMTDM